MHEVTVVLSRCPSKLGSTLLKHAKNNLPIRLYATNRSPMWSSPGAPQGSAAQVIDSCPPAGPSAQPSILCPGCLLSAQAPITWECFSFFSAPPTLAADVIVYLFTCSFLVLPRGLLLPSACHLLLTSVPLESSSAHSSLRPPNPASQGTLRVRARSSLTCGGGRTSVRREDGQSRCCRSRRGSCPSDLQRSDIGSVSHMATRSASE